MHKSCTSNQLVNNNGDPQTPVRSYTSFKANKQDVHIVQQQ